MAPEPPDGQGGLPLEGREDPPPTQDPAPSEGAQWSLVYSNRWPGIDDRTEDEQWSFTFRFRGAAFDPKACYLVDYRDDLDEAGKARRLPISRLQRGLWESKPQVIRLLHGKNHRMGLRWIEDGGAVREVALFDESQDPSLVVEKQDVFAYAD